MEKNDVEQVESSATEEEVVNEVSPETDQQEQVVEQENDNIQEPTVADIATDVAPALDIGQGMDDVDEMGVPYKNRYHEYKRKTEKLEQKVDTLISKLDTNPPGEKKYTKQELKIFADQNPDYQDWANQELEKITKQEQADLIKRELDARDQKQKNEFIKQQTFNSVINQYPEIAIRNKAGQFLGFNNKSDMFQRINSYMGNPQIANNPRGLEVASALAYRDVSLSSSANTRRVMTKQKAEIKNLQKKTLVEGGGKTAVPPASSPAMEKLRQTGSFNDAVDAMSDFLSKSKK